MLVVVWSLCVSLSAAKDRELAGSQKAREDLALSWASMKAELTRLNKNYERCNESLRKTSHTCATLQNENLHLKSELGSTGKANADLKDELARLRMDISTTREELHAGKKLHAVFSSDITMHRQLKENLNSEIRSLQSDLKKSQAGAEELHTRWEQSQAEVASLKADLSTQVDQTKRAQGEVERVAHELGLLRASREVMTKQWEGALTAMHKRDTTMHTVGAAKHAAEAEVQALRNTEQNLVAELSQTRKQHDALASQLSELTQRHSDLARAHDELRRLRDESTRAAELDAGERAQHDTVFDKMVKQNALLQAENERLKLKANQSADQTALVQRKLQDQLDLNARIDASIASVENTSLGRTELENKELRHRAIQLEYAAQLEVNKTTELTEQLKELARKNNMLNSEYVQMERHHEEAIGELKSQQIALDHMTYRANKAESEAAAQRTTKEEERRSEQIALQGNIRNLERELTRKQEEVAHMNHAYVVAEEKVLEAHRQHSDISNKTERLKSELKKAEGVKDRLKTTLEEMHEEKGEILKENNEQRLIVRKHQAQLDVLRRENEELKSKLSDAKFLSLQRAETQEGELAVAKAELVRAKAVRLGATEAVECSERESGLWQRKHEQATLALQALKVEHEKLAGLFFAQQRSLKSLSKDQSVQEKQYAQWTKQFDQMFEKANQAGTGGGVGGASRKKADDGTRKLTFSSGPQLTAKQVLENFNATQASLPANSASAAARAGAQIMGASGGHLQQSGGSSPAMDSLNDMMHLMARQGVPMVATGAANGSQSARTLQDSDSRSSLLSREAGGSGKQSSSFSQALVGELRAALHKSSTAAAEKANQVIKLQHELKRALLEANEAANREGSLLERAHLLSTQVQSLQTNVLFAQQAYQRAEGIAASLERQLRQAHQELMGAMSTASITSTSGGGESAAIRTIDYSYDPELEPSPVLRALLNARGPASSSASLSHLGGGTLTSPNSNANLFSSPSFTFSSSSAASHQQQHPQRSPRDDLEEKSSIARHGRTGRVGLGRSSKGLVLSSPSQVAFHSTDSLPSASIASTTSLGSATSAYQHSFGRSSSSALPTGGSVGHSAAHLLSASQGRLDAPSALQLDDISNQNSYANLPIHIQPKGR